MTHKVNCKNQPITVALRKSQSQLVRPREDTTHPPKQKGVTMLGSVAICPCSQTRPMCYAGLAPFMPCPSCVPSSPPPLLIPQCLPSARTWSRTESPLSTTRPKDLLPSFAIARLANGFRRGDNKRPTQPRIPPRSAAGLEPSRLTCSPTSTCRWSRACACVPAP